MPDARNDFGDSFAGDILQSRQRLEGGIDAEINEILRLVILEDHPAIGESVQHVLEQGTVEFLALAQLLLHPFALGDVASCGENEFAPARFDDAGADLNRHDGTVLAAVRRLEDAMALLQQLPAPDLDELFV